jgi:hypothetical protein
VVVEWILMKGDNLVLIREPMRDSLGETLKHMLAMRDTWDRNGDGKLCGFVTAGNQWKMT